MTLYMIASGFIITIAFTGSGFYLVRTFLVLVAILGLCRINGRRKHRDLANSGESPGIDSSSGGSFGVLAYLILYACIISILQTFSVDTVFRFTPADFESKLYLIASCFFITMALIDSDWYLGRTFPVLLWNSGLCHIN